MVEAYLERTRSKPDISLSETPVQRLLYNDDKNVEGGNYRSGYAVKTVIATGAWPSRLVNLTGVMEANTVTIGYTQ